MAKRERCKDRIIFILITLKQRIPSHLKQSNPITTKRFVKEGTNPSWKTVTKKRTTIAKGFGVPKNSINTITGNIQKIISALQGGKDKYTYSGNLKEKLNYLYYVPGCQKRRYTFKR